FSSSPFPLTSGEEKLTTLVRVREDIKSLKVKNWVVVLMVVVMMMMMTVYRTYFIVYRKHFQLSISDSDNVMLTITIVLSTSKKTNLERAF
ncbi:hypothetical protein L9F63_023909, partial [Diploptera punctata]